MEKMNKLRYVRKIHHFSASKIIHCFLNYKNVFSLYTNS